jgi:hypothetical protein
MGGKVVGPGSLLGSPLSGLCGYVASGGGVPSPSFASDRQDMMMVGRRTAGPSLLGVVLEDAAGM